MATGSSNNRNWFHARSPFVLGLSCMLAAGLFIWYKLRLVTGMPRSAYAVPEVQQQKPSTEKSEQPVTNVLPGEPGPGDSPAH